MPNPWRPEIGWALLSLTVVLVAGWWLKAPLIALLIYVLVYLFSHLWRLNRLIKWLRTDGKYKLPIQGRGVWGEIYHQLYLLKRRHKRRKKRLIKMLERFRKATAALPDATVVLAAYDEIDWFNDAAAYILGLKKGDRGQRIVNLIRHPNFVSYLKERDYAKAVTIPSPANGKIQLEIRIVPYGGGLHLLLARDVTQLRYMERMRSDFVANVSHELRTPITVLRGYLETLQDAGEMVAEPYSRLLMRMEEQTKRMQHLIDDLLYLTRLESNPQENSHKQVAIADLLRSICEEVDSLPNEHAEIKLLLESDADLWGDEQELRSAFSNLVVNAVKYTPASGQVTVRWYEDVNGMRLDVKDTGEGIAEEHIPRLTERFYRVDESESRNKAGTGLGLAIVKHVLTRHQAELKIESELGQGSLFSCCFPPQRTIAPDASAAIKAS